MLRQVWTGQKNKKAEKRKLSSPEAVIIIIFTQPLTFLIMSIVKVIEVISSSEKSFEGAIENALSEASKTVKNIKSIYVKDMTVNVDNNQITSYRVNAKVSFVIKGKMDA